jgi:hypothetical protein
VKLPDLKNKKIKNNSRKLIALIDDIDQRVRMLEGVLRLGPGFIEKILKSKGIHHTGSIPVDRILQPIPSTAISQEIFYHHLHHYSFRLFLRDVITHRNQFTLNQLVLYCSNRVAKKYLHLLLKLGMIQQKGDQFFQLTNLNIHTFGETLEWYIAQVFIREFASPAQWGLQIKNQSPGGDFDILAEVDRRLIYVETKSSPPKGIHLNNVEGFLARVKMVSPDLALFLVDTHLRMEDKIILLFEQAQGRTTLIRQIARGIFSVGENILTLNTKPNVIQNIRVCLNDHFLRTGDSKQS